MTISNGTKSVKVDISKRYSIGSFWGNIAVWLLDLLTFPFYCCKNNVKQTSRSRCGTTHSGHVGETKWHTWTMQPCVNVCVSVCVCVCVCAGENMHCVYNINDTIWEYLFFITSTGGYNV